MTDPHEEKVVAVFDFAARKPAELSIKKGQLLVVKKKDSPGWWTATDSTRQGLIPAQYVKALEEVRILFTLQADNSRKLAVKTGEIVYVVNKDHPDWWKVLKPNGSEGLVPCKFIEVQTDPKWIATVTNGYKATDTTDIAQLNLIEGESILVLKQEKDGWWIGKHLNEANAGVFPAKCVKILREATEVDLIGHAAISTQDKKHPVDNSCQQSLRNSSSDVEHRNSQPSSSLHSSNATGDKAKITPEESNKVEQTSSKLANKVEIQIQKDSREQARKFSGLVVPDGDSETEMEFSGEVLECLHEWNKIIQMQGKEQKLSEAAINALKECINSVEEGIALLNTTSETAEVEIKAKMLAKMEEGRRVTGSDIIFRDPSTGEYLNEDNTPIVSLLHKHQEEELKETITRNDSVKEEKTTDTETQILFEFKSCTYQIGEDVELNFALYSKTENKIITEEFQILVNKTGTPHDILDESKLKTIFKDIEPKDLAGNLHLVCRAVRRGRITSDDDGKKQKIVQDYRRPYGYGMVSFKQVFSQDIADGVAKEAPPFPLFYTKEDVATPLCELLLARSPQLIQRSGGEVKVALSLIKGRFQELNFENQNRAKVRSSTNKLLFPLGVFNFEDKRNDLYLTLESGEFSQGKNIEIVIEVRTDDGERIRDCLSVGSPSWKTMAEYRGVVCYHNSSPKWSETVKINIPPHLFSSAHIKFEARHCSSSKGASVFAFAFMKLVKPDGTVIDSGEYTLPVYKPLDAKSSKSDRKVPYLQEYADGGTKLVARKSEHLVVKVQLTSKLVTQNSCIMKLKQWEDRKTQWTDMLNSLSSVNQTEITTYFQDIFDALFGILESTEAGFVLEPTTLLAYNSMVSLLGVFLSTSQIRNLLDLYIEKNFKATYVHKQLLACLGFYIGGIEPEKHISQITSSFKALDYVLKFISASIINRKKANKASSDDDQEIKRDVAQCMNSFSDLMGKTSPTLIVAQTLALKNFYVLLKYTLQFYTPKELAQAAISFLESIPYGEKLSKINREKLALWKWILQDTSLYSKRETRNLLTPVLITHVKLHIDKTPEEQTETLLLLENVLDQIQTTLKDIPVEEIDGIHNLLGLIQPLTNVRKEERTVSVTCILAIWHLISQKQYDQYLGKLSDDEKKNFVISMCKSLEKLIVEENAFPSKYHSLCNTQTLKVIQLISTYLPKVIWKEELDVWNAFLNLLFTLMHERALQLERIRPSRRTHIKQRLGDMRISLCTVLENLWPFFREQNFLLPQLANKLLTLMIINQSQVKEVALESYYQLLHLEYTLFGNLEKAETHTIDTLDKLITHSKLGESVFRGFFTSKLESKMRPNEQFYQQCSGFLASMEQLLSLLFAMRTLPEGPTYEQERVAATMKVMEYLKKTDRREAYLKYVHMLCHQQEQAENYVEAGFTILLHADLLDWTDNVTALKTFTFFNLTLPPNSPKKRKELLFKAAISNFDKGSYWEKAIELIQELRQNCLQTPDYPYYISLLEQEATLFEKIATTQRFFPEYFRVGYYGKGFPPNIQGKEFIYRGDPMQNIGDFASKIEQRFPDAIRTKSTEPSQEEIEGQVLPSSEDEIKKIRRKPKKVPIHIRKYQARNNVNVFVYSKPVRRGKRIADNEFSDLWLLNNYLITEVAFPSIDRRSEVINRVVVELSPIENAINSISQKTLELSEIIETIESTPPEEVNISSLSMNLNGIIDAAVNGGIAKYQEAFLSPQSLEESKELKDKLREVLRKQVEVIEAGLYLHNKFCTADLKALQQKLEDFFGSMKVKILEC